MVWLNAILLPQKYEVFYINHAAEFRKRRPFNKRGSPIYIHILYVQYQTTIETDLLARMCTSNRETCRIDTKHDTSVILSRGVNNINYDTSSH